MSTDYDVIVVGARCAGAPTAMLLARRGHRVLLVDRATFPSDTVSTHLVHPGGVATLERWGLLDPVVSTGCPPIDTYAFDFGPFSIVGSPGFADRPVSYAPRRTALDAVLVEAAVQAGAEFRGGCTVSSLLEDGGAVAGVRMHDGDRRAFTERARVVVGADGHRSVVAEACRPERYLEKPPLLAGYYSYWTGLPMQGRFESYDRPDRGFAAWPTNDDLTVLICGWPFRERQANRCDIEGNLLATLDMAPEFADRVRRATRVERIAGMSVPNFFRRPYGPGWALVGDAGYIKDFITAQGIQDAFRDAELCAAALDAALTGARRFDDAMADYQSTRDRESLPMYELTTQLAALEPPPPEFADLLAGIVGNQPAMDDFTRMTAGTLSPSAFFASAQAAVDGATRGGGG